MDQKEAKASMGRRDFLKVASVGAAAGAAVVVSGDAKAAVVSADVDAKSGYSKSDHIAKYYELAKF